MEELKTKQERKHDDENLPCNYSGNRSGAATPTSMQTTPDVFSPHKGSLRNANRLARRARSFKEDFLEKIYQIRSPGGGYSSPQPQTASQDASSSLDALHRVGGGASAGNFDKYNTQGVNSSRRRHNRMEHGASNHREPAHEFDNLIKQITTALKYFRNTVKAQKWEMLAGNGTIILDTVWTVNLAVTRCVSARVATVATDCPDHDRIAGATRAMYASTARLIQICDDAVLWVYEHVTKAQLAAREKPSVDGPAADQSREADAPLPARLSTEHVTDVLADLENNIQALIGIAKDMLLIPSSSSTTTSAGGAGKRYCNRHHCRRSETHQGETRNGLQNLDVPCTCRDQQRNSLPDIPLTPRESLLLAETSVVGASNAASSAQLVCTDGESHSDSVDNVATSDLPNSHSSEFTFRDSGQTMIRPPVSPRLATDIHSNCITPPPLPPKKKATSRHCNQALGRCQLESLTNNLERVSLSSRSPDDSLSLLSASAGSLDSRDDDESRLITNPIEYDTLEPHGIEMTDGSKPALATLENIFASNHISYQHSDDQISASTNRLSNTDSGFVSMHSSSSVRNSSCCSQRLSQQSSTSAVSGAGWPSISTTITNAVCVRESSEVISTSITTKHLSSLTSATSTHIEGLDSTLKKFTDCDSDRPPKLPQKIKRKPNEATSPTSGVVSNDGTRQLSPSASECLLQSQDNGLPPPLPIKKKHIMAYMEIFGNSHAEDSDYSTRHSVHMVHQNSWASPGSDGGALTRGESTAANLPITQSCSFSESSSSSRTESQSVVMQYTQNSAKLAALASTPPALPPKRQRTCSIRSTPPQSPLPPIERKWASLNGPAVLEDTSDNIINTTQNHHNDSPLSINELKESRDPAATDRSKEEDIDMGSICFVDMMESVDDTTKYLVLKKTDDLSDIRGGAVDALIINATKATRTDGFTYQEAFLATYRTFISPQTLIEKLMRRYRFFYSDPGNKKRSRESFALLVRVVSDLVCTDVSSDLQRNLMGFVHHLIGAGELTLAKALRVKLLEKHDTQVAEKLSSLPISSFSNSLTVKAPTLLDFKSDHIAEQMTLLDADLFMKIQIPEVLIWVQDQKEETSPNLTRFTEHFNKMSYWARTRILSAESKDREKLFLKFIKVMKHLRKINNFNSYLALLSALDSAPIIRLDWQRHVQDGLKEYCTLIDSSSSFRIYRQALAEALPPCIPYIGLVLQDLTFVHIGNSHLLSNGAINFSKRWQQFAIVENMKRFKKCAYSFKRNDRIIAFFDNFNDHKNEEEMWSLSESIKPRVSRKGLQ